MFPIRPVYDLLRLLSPTPVYPSPPPPLGSHKPGLCVSESVPDPETSSFLPLGFAAADSGRGQAVLQRFSLRAALHTPQLLRLQTALVGVTYTYL